MKPKRLSREWLVSGVTVTLHALVLLAVLHMGGRPWLEPWRTTPLLEQSQRALAPFELVRVMSVPAPASSSPAAPTTPSPLHPQFRASAREGAGARHSGPAPGVSQPPSQRLAVSDPPLRAEPVPGSMTEARTEPVAEAPAAKPQAMGGGGLVAPPAPEQRTTPAGAQAAEPRTGARPDYAYNPAPDYPLALREQGIGGVVWLRVWVDGEGRPGEIRLAKGSGYRLLDDAAMRAVKHWRFVPARSGDQTLASWVEFPIRFALNG